MLSLVAVSTFTSLGSSSAPSCSFLIFYNKSCFLSFFKKKCPILPVLVFLYLSVCLSVFLSFYLSIHPSIQPSNQPTNQPFLLSIYRSIVIPIHPFIHPSVSQSVHPFIHPNWQFNFFSQIQRVILQQNYLTSEEKLIIEEDSLHYNACCSVLRWRWECRVDLLWVMSDILADFRGVQKQACVCIRVL